MTTSIAEATLDAQLTWTGLTGFQREYVFLVGRRYRFDFAWPGKHLAVEVEGGSFVQGRHTQGVGFERDCVKYAEAAIAGWRVMRVTPRMVDDGRALALIERALEREP